MKGTGATLTEAVKEVLNDELICQIHYHRYDAAEEGAKNPEESGCSGRTGRGYCVERKSDDGIKA